MTNPKRTRAEIQAEIEKLQAELEAVPERKWKVGDRFYCEGKVTSEDDMDCAFVDVLLELERDETALYRAALIPAADLIPREEHERAVEMAREVTLTDAIMKLVSWRKAHPSDQFDMVNDFSGTYRVTVERVDADAPEPADVEPVGWANLYTAPGYATGYIYSTSESALKYSKPCHGDETAVPLYRHPVNVEIVLDEYGPGIEGKQVLAMCDGKVLQCVHLADLLPTPDATTAVAPVGVVGGLKTIAMRIRLRGWPSFADDVESFAYRITELPEPDEWARDRAAELRGQFHSDACLKIAAALLAKEGDNA